MRKLPLLLFAAFATSVAAGSLVAVGGGAGAWPGSRGCDEVLLVTVADAAVLKMEPEGAVKVDSYEPECEEEGSFASAVNIFAYKASTADLVPYFESSLTAEGWEQVRRPVDFPKGEGCFYRKMNNGVFVFLSIWASSYYGDKLEEFRMQFSASSTYQRYGGRMC
ncbi:hypothetical protein AB0L44_44190 [Nonomuraea wenchangensis]|uniref:hypothetical protein n=1 Tax=Nonomuraea wenchangensis TaxID=568860 RepID=UPI003439E50C